LSVEDDTLRISGEKREETTTEEEHRFLKERRYGRFERRVALPDGVDPKSVTATYDKGVLTVRVPLPKESKAAPHKVEVSTVV
jgi:HSP20 family protein